MIFEVNSFLTEEEADLNFLAVTGISYPKGNSIRDTYEYTISYTDWDGSNIYVNELKRNKNEGKTNVTKK